MTKKTKKSNVEDRTKTFQGDLLHNDNKEFVKKRNMIEKLTKRRARYWCFRLRKEEAEGVSADDAPKGFKELVESLPGFSTWSKFANSWDIIQVEENTFMIVYRILSVWQEWDHVMDRVAVPFDATPDEVKARVTSLTSDFAKKYGN